MKKLQTDEDVKRIGAKIQENAKKRQVQENVGEQSRNLKGSKKPPEPKKNR